MKAIDVVKEYMKGTCEYAAKFGMGDFTAGGQGYTCKHEKVYGARLYDGLPDRPYTTDDWKVCPLNTSEPPEAK